jgi:hypothetical protein
LKFPASFLDETMAPRQSETQNPKSRMPLLRLYRNQKWIALAALTMGSVMQVADCRNDAALFGLRWAFSSITLPINTFIRDLIFGLASGI